MKDDKILNAMLGNEQMESVARYLSRGRRLQSLDDATLKRLWIAELWRALRESDRDSVLRQKFVLSFLCGASKELNWQRIGEADVLVISGLWRNDLLQMLRGASSPFC
jgi:hypothetical protein